MGPRHVAVEDTVSSADRGWAERLQWGHGTEAVEDTSDAASRPAASMRASMGPRHAEAVEDPLAIAGRPCLDSCASMGPRHVRPWKTRVVTAASPWPTDVLQWGHGT